jgi:hypothetical protein
MIPGSVGAARHKRSFGFQEHIARFSGCGGHDTFLFSGTGRGFGELHGPPNPREFLTFIDLQIDAAIVKTKAR